MSSPRQAPASAPSSAVFDGRRQVLVQAGLVACCSAASLWLGGPASALSALAGGSAALAGTLVFLGILRLRRRAAPTAWQALRDLLVAEAAKWAVSLGGLAMLLAGRLGVEAAGAAPGAAVIAFGVAWAAPLLALVKRN